jgi:hypothetical protein
MASLLKNNNMGKEKNKPKTILETIMEENPGSIDTAFIMDEATLKKNVRRLKFGVSSTLEKTNRFYQIFLYFNNEPFRERIERNLGLVAEVKSNATLFDATKEGDKEKNARIKELTDKNREHKKEWDRLKMECPDFDFQGETEKTEFNKDTLTVVVSKDTISFVNDKAELLHHYRMLLKPMA